MSETYVWFEPTARDVAQGNIRRFGAWLLDDELTYHQKQQRLTEIFAHVAHDGIMLGYGIAKLAGGNVSDEALDPESLLVAEHRGYINAINDIDEGQEKK